MSNGRHGAGVLTGCSGLTLCVAAWLACSCSGNAAPSSSGGAEFETASVERASAGPGVTNVLALTFAAPSNGSAWVSATGTCGVAEPLPVSSVLSAQIESDPSAADVGPGDSEFELGGAGESPTEGSFDATRTLPVATGANTVYLNIDNPSSGGTLRCAATMVVLFGGRQLP
jgi:hypothetical protein